MHRHSGHIDTVERYRHSGHIDTDTMERCIDTVETVETHVERHIDTSGDMNG